MSQYRIPYSTPKATDLWNGLAMVIGKSKVTERGIWGRSMEGFM